MAIWNRPPVPTAGRASWRSRENRLSARDIVGDPHAAIVDLSLTKVVDGDLCSVYSWYDNEFGYTNSLVNHVVEVARLLATRKRLLSLSGRRRVARG